MHHIPDLLNRFPQQLIDRIKMHSLYSISYQIRCYFNCYVCNNNWEWLINVKFYRIYSYLDDGTNVIVMFASMMWVFCIRISVAVFVKKNKLNQSFAETRKCLRLPFYCCCNGHVDYFSISETSDSTSEQLRQCCRPWCYFLSTPLILMRLDPLLESTYFFIQLTSSCIAFFTIAMHASPFRVASMKLMSTWYGICIWFVE